jgi:hypothetical protein
MAKPVYLSIPEIFSVAGLAEPREEFGGSNWAVWSGEAPGYFGNSETRILFLSGDCGWQDVEKAAEELNRHAVRGVPVVVRRAALRVREDLERVKRITGAPQVVPLNDFLFAVVYRALGGTDHLTTGRHDFGLQYFVEPNVRFPAGEVAEPAIAPLLRWLRSNESSGPNVAVLLAPAGLGKTTTCEEVFRRSVPRSRRGIVPLLLKREQWANLAARGSLTMLDIWSSGIATWYPRALMGADQLERSLSAGVVRPILDGFDELCSFFPSDFSPTEIIAELLDVMEEGRVLITSRTQFWEENVAPSVKAHVLEIELHPFSGNQRDDYLLKRFPEEPTKRDAAVRILGRLGSKTQTRSTTHASTQKLSFERLRRATIPDVRFETIPFVVALAAESADVDDSARLENYGVLFDSNDPLEDLLLKFCDRERLRHRLKLLPAEQLLFFQTLAIEFGPNLTTEDISLALEDTCGEDTDFTSLCNHALLVKDGDHYQFRYDFVEDYLVARVVAARVLGQESAGNWSDRALRICSERSGPLVDRCLELIVSNSDGDLLGRIRAAWDTRPAEPIAEAGLTRVMIELAKRLAAGTRRDHAALLLEIIGDRSEVRSFKQLNVAGSMVGLDLSGIRFEECRFVDLEFANCTFDSDTEFNRCYFDGKLFITTCKGFTKTQFHDCELSVFARTTIQRENSELRRVPVTEEQIINAVQYVLSYFQIGAAGFRTRLAESIERRARHLPFGAELLRVLQQSGVLEVFSMSAGNAYRVAVTADVRMLLQNATPVGSVRAAIDSLSKRLIDN